MSDSPIVVGKIVGYFGVRGWVRVKSYTDQPEDFLKYKSYQIVDSNRIVDLSAGKAHGKGLVVQFDGITSREQAEELQGLSLQIGRDRLVKLPPGEYYWADLLGYEVETTLGVLIGTISDFIETGAHDVMVVSGDRERLIPFVRGVYVQSVKTDRRRVVVDWDPEY